MRSQLAREIPRFSIVLITCNQQEYVREAVESVLRSSFTDFELVCVDDGSSDNTLDCLRAMASRDARVEVVALPHSGKPAVSRNAGLTRVTGEYLAFLDGDDVAAGNRLALLDEAIRTSGDTVEVVLHDYANFDDGKPPGEGRIRLRGSSDYPQFLELGRRIGELAGGIASWDMRSADLSRFLLTKAFVVNTGTVCIRRSHFLKRTGVFPTDRVVGEDNIAWLRCILDARTLYVDDVLFFWRKYPGSLTSVRSPRSQRELVRSMQEMAALVKHGADDRYRHDLRERQFEETLELGFIFEQNGARWQAAREYMAAAWTFRRVTALVRATKALIRPMAPTTR